MITAADVTPLIGIDASRCTDLASQSPSVSLTPALLNNWLATPPSLDTPVVERLRDLVVACTAIAPPAFTDLRDPVTGAWLGSPTRRTALRRRDSLIKQFAAALEANANAIGYRVFTRRYPVSDHTFIRATTFTLYREPPGWRMADIREGYGPK